MASASRGVRASSQTANQRFMVSEQQEQLEELIASGSVKKDKPTIPLTRGLEEAARLIKDFSLHNFYQNKITIQDVMKVGDSVDLSELVTGDSNIPVPDPPNQVLVWLKYLLLLDSEARHSHVPVVTDANISDDEDDIFDNESSSSTPQTMNPLDYLVLAYPLCDNQLQRALANKLFSCRLGIPLMLPNYYTSGYDIQLSQLSNIYLDIMYKSEIPMQVSALDAQTDVVSCVRIGDLGGISKSHMLNKLLDDSIYPTFVHFNSTNGSATRALANGLVEMSWKLSEDLMPQTLLNLRGDALVNGEQVRVMSQVSKVMVVFIESDTVSKMNSTGLFGTVDTQVPILFVICIAHAKGNRLSKESMNSFLDKFREGDRAVFHTMFTPNKNLAAFTLDMSVKLQEALESSSKAQYSLAMLNDNMSHQSDVCIFHSESQLSQIFIKIFKKIGNDKGLKDKVLPLQGQPWASWSQKEKDLHRNIREELETDELEDAKTEFDASESIKQERNKSRNQQIALLQNLSAPMKTFITIIMANNGTTNLDTKLVLHFISNALNMMGYLILPELQRKQHSLMSHNKPEAEKMARLIESSSLGLEHFFRELGQVYEAGMESAFKMKYKYLPAAVAALVLKGQPLEIIDGDVVNIPLRWVRDVIKGVIDSVGDKKVLVLSVLGIQSSGKSTLLNTMFGVQFAVSAGRCTKGVYMQLVKANNEVLPFDYVLVLDTEGLRSAEMDDKTGKHRDNELATFVIGLGDITIINIKGENYSEMKDCIQVAVTAFFRMTLIHQDFNKNKRCIFVHQNSAAADAKAKNAISSQKLLDALDKMTEEAARQERIKGKYTFNSIIKFDCISDVWFFPDLWQGNPPMAHVNSEYSRQALRVRKDLFSHEKISDDFKTFSKFLKYMSNLWNAILDENFVFSFRNCIEMSVHSDLDTKYRQMLDEVRKGLRKWEDQICQQSSSDDCDVHLKGVKDEQLKRCKNELTTFCKDNSDSDILKSVIEIRKSRVAQDIERLGAESLSRVRARFDNQQNVSDILEKEESHKKTLMRKAMSLAENRRGHLQNDRSIRREFDSMWLKLAPTDYSLNVSTTRHRVLSDIQRSLYDCFPAHHHKIKHALESIKFDAGNPSKGPNVFLGDLADQHLNLVDKETDNRYTSGDDVWKRCSQFLSDRINQELFPNVLESIQKVSESDYGTGMIIQLVEFIKTWSDATFEYEDNFVTILADLQTQLATLGCQQFYPTLCNIYQRTFSSNASMEEYKERLFRFFTDIIKQVNVDLIVAKHICQQLNPLYLKELRRMYCNHLQSAMLKPFSSKRALIEVILTRLVQRNTFKDYLTYFNRPKHVAVEVLKECVISAKSSEEFRRIAESTTNLIHAVISRTSTKLKSKQNIPVSEWALLFWEASAISVFNSKAVCELDSLPSSWIIQDIDHFEQTFSAEIRRVFSDCTDQFEDMTLDRLGLTHEWLADFITNVWGCEALCPFCDEPCYNQNPDHAKLENTSHKCIQHRPEIIKGRHVIQKNYSIVHNCNYNVSNKKSQFKIQGGKPHKYTNYRKYYKDWFIQGQPSMDQCQYWMWFTATFKTELSKEFNLKEIEVPPSWGDITEELAVGSLR